MCIIKLPRQLEYDSLLDCLSNNSPLLGKENVIDFSTVNFVKPSGIAPLAAIINKWLNHGFKLAFKRSSEHTNSFAYLQRIDFFRAFDVFKEENFLRHDSQGNFLPLQEITYESNTDEIAPKLAKTLTGNEPAFDYIRSELQNCLYESMNNIKDHAQLGPIAGYSLAQNFSRKNDPTYKEYVFTTADAGRGILNSLRENSDLTIDNETHALDLACQKSVSGSPGIINDGYPRNMGEGLTSIDRIVESTNGYFRLISGNAERIRCGKKVEYRASKYPWQGTVVIVKLHKSGIQGYLDALRAGRKEDEVRF
ncbi:MAG: hypothetical protein KAR11_05585 [Phycisphaerae bacterium]|nr:hypothetical protein [Phycisphaerae bacterium]